MSTAAALAKHLQDMVAVRISALPLRIEITTSTTSQPRYDGESLPVRFLNALILSEAVLLMQLHALVQGRFTAPNELCAYCWGLLTERELRDALRMAGSACMSAAQFAEFVRAVRGEAEDRGAAMKRVREACEEILSGVPKAGSRDVMPGVLAVLLILLMVLLVSVAGGREQRECAQIH